MSHVCGLQCPAYVNIKTTCSDYILYISDTGNVFVWTIKHLRDYSLCILLRRGDLYLGAG